MALHLRFSAVAAALALAGCGPAGNEDTAAAPAADETAEAAPAAARPETEAWPEPGIELPEGFTATVFARGVGRARHLVVRDDGVVFVALRQTEDAPGGIVALADGDGDGRADVERRFGREDVHTGIALHEGYLYYSSADAVYRTPLPGGQLASEGEPELVVGGFPKQRAHAAKAIAFDPEGHLYVESGAPSNACQESIRTPGSPGQRPCPELERSGGIWRFVGDSTGQDQSEGFRYATGLRHSLAMDWHPEADALFMVMHGRDQLDSLWPEHYSTAERVRLPAEEFHRVDGGDDFGWPYTYWDPERGERMVAPEYGGDGESVSDESDYESPAIGFPAHWAPNDLVFYTAEQFPERYRNGAFIAFHGSWNRAPEPQGGYNVVFAPFEEGAPTGEWEVFAEGFPGVDPIPSPGDAEHRPTGLAVGPDGALYISDSVEGRIWRVTWAGDE